MSLQVLKDSEGKNMGVFIPMKDWLIIIQKHEDLQQLVSVEAVSKKNLSALAGSISYETAQKMLHHVSESRDQWEERIKKHSKTDVFIRYKCSH